MPDHHPFRAVLAALALMGVPAGLVLAVTAPNGVPGLLLLVLSVATLATLAR